MFEEEIKNFGTSKSFLTNTRNVMENRRDLFVKVLFDAGLKPIIPRAGYFLTANWTSIADKIDKRIDNLSDVNVSEYLIQNAGVQGMPFSAFVSETSKHTLEGGLRYCFIRVK